MELADLTYGLSAVSSSGFCLNCQELVGVQAGLTKLKSAEKFSSVYFWGKIFAQTSDYYIAYGLKDSEFEFPCKTFFFATSSYEFYLLESLTEEIADKIVELELEKPLTGDPLAPVIAAAEPGEEGAEEMPPLGITECQRLSQVVQEIDFDTACVPKGAYALNEARIVVPNGDFRGLGSAAAPKLESYVHLRPPASVASLRAAAKDDTEFYANFLDPLVEDLPKGCWAVRQDPASGLVTLRSLTWHGYVAFHSPGTTMFGGLYFGHAQKTRDLPFVL